jgi:fumarate hydratase class II
MFQFGDDPMPLELIHAIARIKRAAAQANRSLGQLDDERCGWIVQAAGEVSEGRHDGEFPLSCWQSGSGTQTNMNVNEVIDDHGATGPACTPTTTSTAARAPTMSSRAPFT